MRAFRCLALIVLCSLVLVWQTAHAAHYATYHIHHVYLTPYKVAAATTVGYSTADSGTTYLIVSFHEVNNDDVQEEYANDDMKVAVGGRIVDEAFVMADNLLSSIVLDPGAKANGIVVWQVPAGAHSAQLRWSPQPLFSDAKWPTYTWDVAF